MAKKSYLVFVMSLKVSDTIRTKINLKCSRLFKIFGRRNSFLNVSWLFALRILFNITFPFE